MKMDLPHKTDWIKKIGFTQKLECIDAFFAHHAYDMHRHNT